MVSVAIIEARKENLAPRHDGWDIRLLIGEKVSDMDIPSDPLGGRIRKIRNLRAEYCAKQVPLNLADDYTLLIDDFKEWVMYKNDLRLVGVCLEYAGMSRDPRQMFVFMQKYGIGQKCSLLYEGWSNYLETTGKLGEAIKVLDFGISEDAQPVEYLEMLRCDVSRRQHEQLHQAANSSSPSQSFSQIPGDELESLNKVLIPHFPKVKKRKFAIYSDVESETETGSTMPPLPNIKEEKKENNAPRTAFQPVLPEPELNHDLVSQAINTQDSTLLSLLHFHRLTFSEQLLIMRPFSQPIGTPGIRRLSSETFMDITTELIKHDERLYQNHNGHTEVLTGVDMHGIFSIGDTEVLK